MSGSISHATCEITEADIVAIMEQNPTLSAFGFGCFGQYHTDHPSDNPEELRRDREELRCSLVQCRKACEWLSSVEQAKSINKRHSSYGLKHQVERCYSPFYCSNGAFITAAIFLRFRWKADGPNAYFNFQQKSIDRLLNANN